MLYIWRNFRHNETRCTKCWEISYHIYEKKIQAYWKNDLSIETKTKYFEKTTIKKLREIIIMNDANKESMNLSSMDIEEEEDAIKYYYKTFLSIRKTINTLDKNINELYIKDTEYVTDTPKKDSIEKTKSRKTKLMMTNKYLYTRLFAMKYDIPIAFVQCQYDGQKDMITGQPKDTMYSLFIFHYPAIYYNSIIL